MYVERGGDLLLVALEESTEPAEEGSVKGFGEGIRDHVGRGDVLEDDVAGIDAFFDVKVAHVDMLGALGRAGAFLDHDHCGLVILHCLCRANDIALTSHESALLQCCVG